MLFNDTPIAPVDGVVSPENPPQGNVYELLVGEGKKFKDNEALAQAKLESDDYILHLKSEMDKRDRELEKRLSLEQLMNQVKPQTPIAPSNDSQGLEQRNENGSLSKEQIAQIVSDAIKNDRTQSAQQANIEKVRNELIKQHGHRAQQVYKQRAVELGMSEDMLFDVAAKSPTAFMKLVSGEQRTQERVNTDIFTPPVNQVRHDNSGNSGVKDEAYWDKLATTDPKTYFSPEATLERHRSAQALKRDYFRKT